MLERTPLIRTKGQQIPNLAFAPSPPNLARRIEVATRFECYRHIDARTFGPIERHNRQAWVRDVLEDILAVPR